MQHRGDEMPRVTRQRSESQGSKESAPASSKSTTTAQQRRNRKRQTDRVAQQQHRKRQKQYVVELEEKLKILQSNDQSEVVRLGMHNFRLQKELESFHALHDDMADIMKRYQNLTQNSVLFELSPTITRTETTPNAGKEGSTTTSNRFHTACQETMSDVDYAMSEPPTQQPVVPGASCDRTIPETFESEQDSEPEEDTAAGTEWPALDYLSDFDFGVEDALQPPVRLDQDISEESSEDWAGGMGTLPVSFSGATDAQFGPPDAASTVTSRDQGQPLYNLSQLLGAQERPHQIALSRSGHTFKDANALNAPRRRHLPRPWSGVGGSGNTWPARTSSRLGKENEQPHFNFGNLCFPTTHPDDVAPLNQFDDDMLQSLPTMLLDPLGGNSHEQAASVPFLVYPHLQEDQSIFSIIERARDNDHSIGPPQLLEFLLDNPRNTLSVDLKSYLEPVRRTRRTSEFLATYWVLYLLLRWYIVGDEESYQSLPAWLRPTQLQRTIKHPVAISLVAWPSLREEILRTSQFSESSIHEVLTDIGKHLSVCIETSDIDLDAGNIRIGAQITNLANWKLDDAFFDRYPRWKGIAT